MAFNITDGVTQIKPIMILKTGIDAKVAGAVLLGTQPAGKLFIPFWGGVVIESRTGFTSAPTISIGTNATAYDSIAAAAALTGLLQGNVAPIQFKAQYPFLTPSTQTFLNVSVAAAATTYTITIGIMGFLVGL
jgi:hypothetical protein